MLRASRVTKAKEAEYESDSLCHSTVRVGILCIESVHGTSSGGESFLRRRAARQHSHGRSQCLSSDSFRTPQEPQRGSFCATSRGYFQPTHSPRLDRLATQHGIVVRHAPASYRRSFLLVCERTHPELRRRHDGTRHANKLHFQAPQNQMTATPNHALQRTAPRVTVAAICSSDPSRPSHLFL